MKNVKFLHITLIFFALAFVSAYILSLFRLVNAENELYARYFLIGIFVVSFLLLVWQNIRHHKFSFNDILKNETAIIVTLSILLMSCLFHKNFSIYATGFFVGAVLFYLILNGKFYSFSKIYIFLFLYALLQLFGTIGTKKGFHFPEMTYTFYLVPFAFSFFKLSEKTLLKIAQFFFRITFIYLIICILYWWFNFQYLNYNLTDWVTNKLFITIDMPHWLEQREYRYGNTFSAFLFVNAWSIFFHPTHISFTISLAMILGIYLFYKNKINFWELLFFVVSALFTMILLESRIGFVFFVLILLISFLIYVKLKTKYFKIVFLTTFLALFASVFLLKNSINNFVADDVRYINKTLAINYIEDNFWWGNGTRQQWAALLSQAEKMKNEFHIENYYDIKTCAHNQFLGDMVQFGIFGAVFLAALLISIMIFAIKQRSYLLAMLVLTLLLFMQIDEPFYTQEGITTFTIFLTFFVAISQSKEKVKFFDLYAAIKKFKI